MNIRTLSTLAMILFMVSVYGQNPVILSCIEEVRADSIQATMEHLESYGTRYALADNRKAVATWIKDKFYSFGYPDVKLDSFQVEYKDSTYWQYNVVCTLTGISASGETCIMGGHYDSYCTTNPELSAPGVDDNGSAVAATLEAARVMKLANFQPESTIRFILFAGEELGYWGSNYQAETSKETGENIILMMNMDMIAYNPDTLREVFLFRYQGAEPAYDVASSGFQQYTTLSVVTGPLEFQHRSDSYTFWQRGFQATWAFEYDFNDYYHTVDDVVSHCNIGYCAEITRGALATIMEMQFLPFPQGIVAHSSAENITVSWKQTANANLKGYRVFRSDNDSNGFVPLNSALITDTFFVDPSVGTKKDYYYHVKLVNDSMQESVASQNVHGARFQFSDTLMVVACMKDVQTTPDSILQFYASILDSIPFRWFDLNRDHPLTLSTLSQYRNTLWVINSLEYDKIPDQLSGDLETFFANHGNMMFAGFSFSRFMLGSIGFPMKFPDNSIISKYFRADSVDKKISSYMYRAYPDEAGYDTLWLDTHKSFKPGYPGELNNIEVFTPASGGIPVYRFDSKYGPGTPQGSQQGKIVGLEHMGNDFKTILLSFPLYYVDTADARQLMRFVMKHRFVDPTNVPDLTRINPLEVKVFPNPVHQSTTFSYALKESSRVKLEIFDSFGRLVETVVNIYQQNGEQQVTWNTERAPSGIYFYRVQDGHKVGSGKVIKL